MGLDATVYCGCFEQGKLRSRPDASWKLYISEYGQVECSSDDLDTLMAFDSWRLYACDHEAGELLSHRIGNIAHVAFLRECLSAHAEWFPIILEKVIYSGTHCGDQIDIQTIREMIPEVDRVSSIRCRNSQDQQCLDTFRQQMSELSQCALAAGKPIVF